MTLFNEPGSVQPGAPVPPPAPQPPASEPPAPHQTVTARLPRAFVPGIYALVGAIVAMLILTTLPTNFVIQRPGPVVDTLGSVTTADGTQVPLISVEGAETYPTDGTLDLLTVQVVGNRENTPTWFELAVAWFTPSLAVVPMDQVFPEGVTTEQRTQQNTQLMSDSQKEATAAALTSLGYDVQGSVRVVEIVPGGAADGTVELDDIVIAADGNPVIDVQDLRDVVAASSGDPITITVLRVGAERDLTVTPILGEIEGNEAWVIGVLISPEFRFPIDVTIQLDNIGGPSAGMMFTLGIIDTLTLGSLTGGHRIAGTGTITASGEVGPIGGIRQKLYGALDAGAEFFLAPVSNCDEVVGHVPGDLRVFAVETLDDALHVLEVIRADGDLESLPTCVAP